MSRSPRPPELFALGTATGFAREKGAEARRAQALELRRGDRWKALALAGARLLAACAVSAALGLGAYQGFQWCTRSSLFAVRNVRVRGNVHAPAPELIARSGLLSGQNLFRVDLAAAARGVESSPWITSAAVSRQLPSSIEIEVREHTPVARVQLGAPYFTDLEGRLFKRVSEDDDAGARALPLITGLARADWEQRRDDALLQLRASIELVTEWREAGLPEGELAEVRVDSDGALTAISHPGIANEAVARNADIGMERDGSGASEAAGRTGPRIRSSTSTSTSKLAAPFLQEARVGRAPFTANLHRLLRVRTELQRRGESASRIDLDNPSRPDEVAAQIVRNDEPSTARPKGQSARGE